MIRQSELVTHELSSRFKLIRQLGSGGFGAVYEAYDREREALVALKTLTDVSPTHLARFKREFRALTDLVHPNLVTLYELHHHHELWFFTMELLRGRDFIDHVTLRPGDERQALSTESTPDITMEEGPSSVEIAQDSQEWLRAAMRAAEADPQLLSSPSPSPLRSPRAAAHDMELLRRMTAQLARGVMALHEARRLHRDIKPSNILVTTSGRVVLLDFGLVCELDLMGPNGFSRLRTPAHFVGTPHYMAPEQAMGREVSPASDWYSVGVLLYQALTGHRPVEGKSPLQILLRKQSIEPRDVRELRPDAPSELAELAMRLLEREPEDRPEGAEILAALSPEPSSMELLLGPRAPSVYGPKRAPFVGRARELEQLKRALHALIHQRQGAILSVSGPSGLGKTALLRRFLRHARRLDASLEVLILEGRCYENESVPYKGVDSLIDQLAEHLESQPAHEVAALLEADPGAAGSIAAQLVALSRVFPVLRRVQGIEDAALQAPQEGAQEDAALQRHLAFEGLRELLARLARRHALVLVMDDVQWADEDSAQLMEHVLLGPGSPPLLWALAFREEEREQHAFLRRALALMRQADQPYQAQELVLEPLSEEEARQLASALLIDAHDPSALRHIVQESSGSPFFVYEMARHLSAWRGASRAESLHVSLEQVLYERTQQLSLSARTLLELLCVAGRPLPMDLARRAAQLGGRDQDALALLKNTLCVQVRSVRQQRLLEPYHDRVRLAVLARQPIERTRELHLTLAQLLALEPGQDPEIIARHFLHAGQAQQALPHLQEAAEAASRALAFERAAQLYQEVLELRPWPREQRARLHERVAQCHGYVGRGTQAAQHFLEASEHVQTRGERRALRLSAANQRLRVGDHWRGLELLDELLDSSALPRPRKPAAMMVKLLAQRTRLQLRGVRVDLAKLTQTPDEEARWRLELCWGAAQGVSAFDLRLGAYLGLTHLLEALECCQPHHLCCALATEAIYLCGVRRTRARGEQLLAQAASLTPLSHDRAYCEGLVCFSRGMTHYLRGSFQPAIDAWQEGLALIERECVGMVWESEGMRLYRYAALELQGVLTPFWAELPRRLELARQRQDEHYSMAYELWGHFGLLAQDRPEAMRASLERLGPRLAALPNYCLHHFWQLLSRMNLALYEGQPQQAWQVAQASWPALKRALIMQTVEIAAVTAYDLRGRVALSLWRHELQAGHRASGALEEVQGCARRLERLELPCALAMASALRAQLKQLQQEQGWVGAWEDAIAALEEAQLGLRAQAMRLALSMLQGRAPAQEPSWEAIKALGARAPQRWAAFYAPVLKVESPSP